MTCKVLSCVVPVVLLSTGLVGCDTNPVKKVPFKVPIVAWNDDGDYLPARVGPGLVAMQSSPIPDVPMPIGFKPVRSVCSSSFDGVARTVTHVYQGRASTDDTVRFYNQQLALYDWQRVDQQTQEDGSVNLYYEKGAESLGLHLSDLHGIATVEVYITPR